MPIETIVVECIGIDDMLVGLNRIHIIVIIAVKPTLGGNVHIIAAPETIVIIGIGFVFRVLHGQIKFMQRSTPRMFTGQIKDHHRIMGIDEFSRGRLFESLGLERKRPTIAPVIGEVEADGPADRGGLRRGDRVVALDGEKVDSWRSFVEFIRAHGEQSVEMQVQRGTATVTLIVRPELISGEGATHGRIGAGVTPPHADNSEFYATVRYAPWTAFSRAVAKTWDMSILTLRMLWKMVTLEISVKHLSGPISIAQYAGISAEIGITRFLDFLAIVSISLGILNLLPIPILDGGHLLYYLIESVLGRPVSEEAQFFGQRLGIAMLFGLMGLAFYNDLARIFG